MTDKFNRTEDEHEALSQVLSGDRRLNRLLKTMLGEVKGYAESQIAQLRRLADIGIALSAEKDIDRLLEKIVYEARTLTNADAGTLYVLDEQDRVLRFETIQNDTMNVKISGAARISLPPIPLEKDGLPNYSNVSSYVALTGKIANIADVYESELFDFQGPKSYDEKTGYRSKSMLVIPMQNHEGDSIGVLQLLNSIDPETGRVQSFSEEYVELIASLSSQAAVALTNAELIHELKSLLYSFIKSIGSAIDAKSPHTGCHIQRVVELTAMIAEMVDTTTEGSLASVNFTPEQLEEIRLAAWMHDVGKITTPEHIVAKRTKLEAIFDRVMLVETRFDLVRQIVLNHYLERKIELDCAGNVEERRVLDSEFERKLQELDEEKAFVISCNDPAEFMEMEKIDRLSAIARKTYELHGRTLPYITEDELHNLSVRKGTLTAEERTIIENHALMTLNILKELPFPKGLKNIPKFAAYHHERLDGSGYPFGIKEEELPLASRIMAIADIFEALTARDRPYKKPIKLSQAIEILGFMKKQGHIDPAVFDLFIKSGLYRTYAEKELDPDQIDL